jgi:hypothetical protein
MTRRTRSALFGIFLVASQILQGGLAAMVSCSDDSPGVLVPALSEPSAVSHDVVAARGFNIADCPIHRQQHCIFCGTGGCHMAHVPALGMTLVPLFGIRLHALDAPAPAVDSYDFQFDVILRPPK